MCHNHSHILAELVGEDTSTALPALTFLLRHPVLRVETAPSDGGLLLLKTSGLLRVPSLMLAGYSAPPPPATEACTMSLYLLPEDAMTTILRATWAWMNASQKSLDQWGRTARLLQAIQKSSATEEIPPE